MKGGTGCFQRSSEWTSELPDQRETARHREREECPVWRQWPSVTNSSGHKDLREDPADVDQRGELCGPRRACPWEAETRDREAEKRVWALA